MREVWFGMGVSKMLRGERATYDERNRFLDESIPQARRPVATRNRATLHGTESLFPTEHFLNAFARFLHRFAGGGSHRAADIACGSVDGPSAASMFFNKSPMLLETSRVSYTNSG